MNPKEITPSNVRHIDDSDPRIRHQAAYATGVASFDWCDLADRYVGGGHYSNLIAPLVRYEIRVAPPGCGIWN